MNQPNRPKGPAVPPEAQDGPSALADGASGSGLPAMAALTLEAPEELTDDDLAARANVGFALDLEPFLPGPAVGSEVVLLETDPEAARRLGVRMDVGIAAVAPPPFAAAVVLEQAPPPTLDQVDPVGAAAAPPLVDRAPPQEDLPDVDVEPVLEPPPPAFEPASRREVHASPSWDAPPGLAASPAWMPPPPAPAVVLPPPVLTPPPPMVDPPRPRGAPSLAPPVAAGVRVYPLAWAWAGLGLAPQFGGRAGARPAPERGGAAEPKAAMEDLLDLAAVGKGADGVTEMLLIFKEDVLRGLTATLRMEKEGMRAHFVAPDETVRRYVESTAEDLLARMRRRGLKVAGWTVVVGG